MKLYDLKLIITDAISLYGGDIEVMQWDLVDGDHKDSLRGTKIDKLCFESVEENAFSVERICDGEKTRYIFAID